MGKRTGGLLVLMLVFSVLAAPASDDLVLQSAVPVDGWAQGESVIEVAPDGVMAAVGYGDGRVVLWNLSMRYRIGSLQVGAHAADGIQALRFGLGGERLLAITGTHFSVFDTRTQQRLSHHPIAHTWDQDAEDGAAPFLDWAMSRDASWFAISDFGVAAVATVDEHDEIVPELLPDAGGARLALSDDGAWVAVVGFRQVRVLATDTGAQRAAWPVGAGEWPNYPGSLRFSPDGAQLLAATGMPGRGGGWLLDIDTGNRVTLRDARQARFMADGSLVFIDQDGCFQRKPRGGARQALPIACRRDAGSAFAVTNDVVFSAGRLLHAPSGEVLGELDATRTRLQLTDVDEARGQLAVEVEYAASHPLFFAWPDRRAGRPPATGLQHWDLATGERSEPRFDLLPAHPIDCLGHDRPDRLDAIARMDDGGYLLAAGHTVYLCRDGRVAHRIQRQGAPLTWLRWREIGDGEQVLFANDNQGQLEVISWPDGALSGVQSMNPLGDEQPWFGNLMMELDLNAQGELWMLTRLGLFLANGQAPYTGMVTASLWQPEQDRLVLATPEGVRIFRPSSGVLGEPLEVSDLAVHTLVAGEERLYAQTSDGAVHVLAVNDGTRLMRLAGLYPVAERGLLVLSPEGQYAASRDAVSSVTRRDGTALRAFSLFDAERNRPDRVLASLGHARADYIEQLTRLVSLRQQRLQERGARLDEALLPAWAQVPPLFHDGRSLEVSVQGPENASLHLFVANVRATPADGVPVHSGVARHTLTLMPGDNRITAHLSLPDGRRSDDLMARVYSKASAAPRRTFLLGVGVSEHVQSQYNLRFAAKDIKDVAAHFTVLEGEQIETLLLTDREATRASIMRARRFLERAGLDDRVILYFAGHGVLADDGVYYFAPTDMDFAAPAQRGIRFDEIEGLLADTRARERLIFMDSCHAGENDEGAGGLLPMASPLPGGQSEVASQVSARGLRRVGAIPDDAPEIDRPLLEDIFVELREGSGAHIIAASGAMEFALESARWNNGVFTAAVLEGLEAMAADLDGDRQIRVDELRRFVADRVAELTRGRQVPTVRGSNPALDFAITRATEATQEAWNFGFEQADPAPSQVQSIAFSGDGRTVVTLQNEGVRRFDVQQGRLQTEVPLSLDRPRSLRVDHRGRYALVLADDYVLQRIDLQTGEQLMLGDREQGGHLASEPLVAWFSDDGQQLLVEGNFPDRGLRWFDMAAGTARTVPVRLPGFLKGVAALGQGFRVVDEQGVVVDLVRTDEGTLAEQTRWQLPDPAFPGIERESWQRATVAHQTALSRDGRYLLRAYRLASGGHGLEAWDLEERRMLMTRHAPALRSIAVTEAGRAALWDGDSYRVLHLPSATEPEWLYRGEGQEYMPWAFHPAGHTVIAPRWREGVQRWSLRH
ncbi:MAG: hypothetical protein C0462_08560 [Alcanivorax sp.]|nr:hypothetical protein [Alcanivorax sp.]